MQSCGGFADMNPRRGGAVVKRAQKNRWGPQQGVASGTKGGAWQRQRYTAGSRCITALACAVVW